MAQFDLEVSYFHYCRDHQGNPVPVDMAKQNGRLVPRFPQAITEPYLLPEDEETPDYVELVEEVCQNLTGKERRRWLLAIRDKQSITDIAATDCVTRQAIIDSFRRMARRNPYVRIWLDHKNRTNQHL
jgi:hypothetical protein